MWRKILNANTTPQFFRLLMRKTYILTVGIICACMLQGAFILYHILSTRKDKLSAPKPKPSTLKPCDKTLLPNYSIPKTNDSLYSSSGKLSLIIPSTKFNYHCFIQRLLEFIYTNCTYIPEEIIIIVSGVPESGLLPLKPPPHVTLVQRALEGKVCASAARNLGASIATGEVLTFFDADDMPHRQRFEIIHQYFRRTPQAGGALFRCVQKSPPSPILLIPITRCSYSASRSIGI